MKKAVACLAALVLISLTLAAPIDAQQPQIPSLQVGNPSKVVLKEAVVQILSRKDLAHSGTFVVSGNADLNGATPYPTGGFQISVSMSDSMVNSTIYCETIEQLTTTGKHSPTAFISGRCAVKQERILPGCKYWMMVANNKPSELVKEFTPDVISFLVFDKNGTRIAYGTGPVIKGYVSVAPSGY